MIEIHKEYMLTVFRYILTSFLGYLFLAFGTYTLPGLFGSSAIFSFMVSLMLLYAFDYFMNLQYVFENTHGNLKLLKYLIFQLISGTLGSLLFCYLSRYIDPLHFAIFATQFVLFPIRFCISKRVFT
jgi:hypothetical protein